jgi:hypothetical protein
MGKHIKSFSSNISRILEENEPESIYPSQSEPEIKPEILDPFVAEIRDKARNREMNVNAIREKWNTILASSLDQCMKDIKELERIKTRSSESYQLLISQAKEAVYEIESVGERFENDMYELQNVYLFFTKESEKMLKLSDEDYKELFKIIVTTNEEIAQAALDYGLQSGRLNLEKEFKVVGVSSKRPETVNPDGTVKVNQRFPQKYVKDVEYVNESVLSSIGNFFKGIISNIKSKFFGIDSRLDSIEANIKKLKAIADKL